MKNLLSEDLRNALCRILFGDEKSEHLDLVVPLQGNFMSPQQILEKKPTAYFTYYISNTTKELLNNDNNEGTHTACVARLLELSCIGKDAERLMLDTLFWDERTDIRDIFNEYGTILMETPRTILARPYYQNGLNTILAYSTTFKLSSSIELQSKTEHWDPDSLVLSGGLTVEA